MTQDNTPIPTLKSCPFCGGTDILVQELGEGRGSANYWVAACFNPNCCEAGKTEAEAIEVWNRRAAATIPTLAEKIREIPNPFESDKFRYCFREALSAAAALVEVEAANPPIGSVHSVDAPAAPLPLVSKASCQCHACAPITAENMRMVLCEKCGNKRCPHANNHWYACTNSNDAGQIGSAYA